MRMDPNRAQTGIERGTSCPQCFLPDRFRRIQQACVRFFVRTKHQRISDRNGHGVGHDGTASRAWLGRRATEPRHAVSDGLFPEAKASGGASVWLLWWFSGKPRFLLGARVGKGGWHTSSRAGRRTGLGRTPPWAGRRDGFFPEAKASGGASVWRLWWFSGKPRFLLGATVGRGGWHTTLRAVRRTAGRVLRVLLSKMTCLAKGTKGLQGASGRNTAWFSEFGGGGDGGGGTNRSDAGLNLSGSWQQGHSATYNTPSRI